MFARLFPLLFTLAVIVRSAVAEPIVSVNLASPTEWTIKKETDPGWTITSVPAQVSVKKSCDKWIDYKRLITIPNAAIHQTAEVRLSSINDGGEIYIDDKKAGTVNYGLFPVEIDITDLAAPGTSHTLTVRCFSRNHYYPPGAFPQDHNGEELLGIPRGISLNVYPEVHVADTFVVPSVTEDSLRYTLWIANHSDRTRMVTVTADLSPWNRDAKWDYPTVPAKIVALPPQSVTKVDSDPIAWKLGRESYWWPNIPFRENYEARLHIFHFTLKEGDKTLDVASQRFGFAEYSEGPDYYTINEVRIFQFEDSTQEHMWSVGGRDGFQIAYQELEGWGNGPNGARETWLRYLRVGINSFRLHTSAGSESMLNAADEVGFMLTGESGIRGWDKPEEKWDPVYKPAAVRAMVRHYRTHPAVVRYSLDNEWAEASQNEDIGRQLIDAAVAEDSSRLLSFSQDKEPWVKKLFGSDRKSHAWVLCHYHRPPTQTGQIAGVEEDFWDRRGTSRNELIGCARAAILYRLNNYAVFSPWSWNNYWCNFVAGGSKSTGTVNPLWRNKDRYDGVDGWGSDIVRFVQNCYSIFAAADVDLIENHLNNEAEIFDVEKTVSYEDKVSFTRQMVIFNNDLTSHRMSIIWETHLDNPNGLVTAKGETEVTPLHPGEHTNPVITIPCPGTGSAWRPLYFVVRTNVDGVVRFSESRYVFKVKNPDAHPAASTGAPDFP